VRVGELVGAALCEPPALKYRPPTPYAAKFSMPYLVASALTHGEVTSESFTAQAIADPQVLALADKVHYEFDPLYDEGAALRGWLQVRQTTAVHSFDRRSQAVARRKTPGGVPTSSASSCATRFRSSARTELTPSLK